MAELTNIPSRRNRRRNFQFSLRTFLIVLTIFGVWLGLQVRNAQRQKEAVKAILAAGGYILYDYQRDADGKDLRDSSGRIIEEPDPPGPDWLRNLIGQDYFVNVTGVIFDGVSLTDEQLIAIGRQLEQMPRLRSLDIHNNSKPLTDDGILGLANLIQIKELQLYGNSNLTGKALEHLRSLTQLKTLEIFSTHVDDNGLRNLEGMKNLERLELSFTRITDQGLTHLENLNNLKYLGLCTDAISDAGVKELARHPNLIQLDLGQTQITDSAVPALISLKNLLSVSVQQTAVTSEGVSTLHDALPKATITTTNGRIAPPGTPAPPPSPF